VAKSFRVEICPRHSARQDHRDADPGPAVTRFSLRCRVSHGRVVPEASGAFGEHRRSLWHSRNGNRSPPCGQPV